MSEPSPCDFLADPLSDATRKERRNLLIVSMAGILVVKMNLVPSRLSTLGIEFASPAQSSFIVLVAVVVFYFIIAFLAYGVSDLFVCYKKYLDYLVASQIQFESWSQEDQEKYDELYTSIPRATWLYLWSKPVFFFRIFFEFVIPLLAGAISFCLLVLKVARP